jgi:hypothetical protein
VDRTARRRWACARVMILSPRPPAPARRAERVQRRLLRASTEAAAVVPPLPQRCRQLHPPMAGALPQGACVMSREPCPSGGPGHGDAAPVFHPLAPGSSFTYVVGHAGWPPPQHRCGLPPARSQLSRPPGQRRTLFFVHLWCSRLPAPDGVTCQVTFPVTPRPSSPGSLPPLSRARPSAAPSSHSSSAGGGGAATPASAAPPAVFIEHGVVYGVIFAGRLGHQNPPGYNRSAEARARGREGQVHARFFHGRVVASAFSTFSWCTPLFSWCLSFFSSSTSPVRICLPFSLT